LIEFCLTISAFVVLIGFAYSRSATRPDAKLTKKGLLDE